MYNTEIKTIRTSANISNIRQATSKQGKVTMKKRGKMTMKKIGLLALSAMFLMSGTAFAAGKEVVNYWSRHGSSDVAIMQKMVGEFNASHPGIDVKLQFLTWGGAYYGKVRSSILAGNPPQIFDVAAYAPPMFRNNVESFSAEELAKLGINLSNFVPSAWKAVEYKGRYYGTVNAILPLGLYYNTDMFKKAGLDPSKPPRNLKEFLEYAKKLTVDTNGDGKIDQWGFMLRNNFVPTPWIWESILVQSGGSILNKDLTKATFNTKAGIDALNLMLNFSRKYKIAPSTLADTTTAFVAKKVAMVISGPWDIAGYKGKKMAFGTAPMPQFGTQKPAAWSSLDIYFFPKGLRKDAKKWKATMTFAAWAAGPGGGKYYAQMFLPSLLSVLNGPVMKDPYMSGFAREATSGGIYFPQAHKAMQEIYAAIWSNLQGAFAGKMTAEEALSLAEEQTNRILAR